MVFPRFDLSVKKAVVCEESNRGLHGRLYDKEITGAPAQFPGALRSLLGQPLILHHQ